MHIPKTVLVVVAAFLLNPILCSAQSQAKELPPLVPGTLDWDYIWNSFSEFAVDAENGVERWVQNFVDEIKVTPDGTVIVGCDWDEGGRCLGLYKDGRPSGAALGKNDRKGGHRNGGWGTSTSAMTVAGNEILCASNDGEFYRFGWTPGDLESPRFLDSFVHGFGDTMNDKSAAKVIGMNSRGNLVALVLANGFVEVRERSGWKVQQRFAAPGVHDAAWSADDRLWLATAISVREVDVTGQVTGRTAPDPGTPSAIAVSPQGELVACDDGPRQQIRFYAIAGLDVRLAGTFGQRGGISAGTAGEPLPEKLMSPTGANQDAAGNLYVALRYDELSPTGGLILRSFDPAGKLRWEVACHVFSECMDVLPSADGSLTAYGFRSIFTKAKDARRGDWKLDAITLDSRNQPADPRYQKALLQATTAWRMVDGVPYFFSWGSGGNSPLEITRLENSGRLAVHHQTIGTPGPWAFDVDATGAVWIEDGPATLLRRKPLGGGKWGEPERLALPLPLPLTEVHRVTFGAAHDVMYASGYTSAVPKPSGE